MEPLDIESVVVGLPLQMLQHRGEIIPFAQWLRASNVQSILEIGTGPGGTTLLWGKIAASVISIDLPSSDTSSVHRLLEQVIPNFLGLGANSQWPETVEVVRRYLDGKKVDLLFIDGDHTYASVKWDFEKYGEFVRDGGWISFHDINAGLHWPNMEVPIFWNELVGEKTEFTVQADWGGIGVIRK